MARMSPLIARVAKREEETFLALELFFPFFGVRPSHKGRMQARKKSQPAPIKMTRDHVRIHFFLPLFFVSYGGQKKEEKEH